MTTDFNRTATTHQGEQVTHTERSVKSPSPRTGLFAALRAFLPGAKGSCAPSRALLATSLLGLAALLAPAGAQATTPTLIPDGQFESPRALGVAVDNSGGSSQGDVYLASFFSFDEQTGLHFGQVNKFDPAGNPLSPPSPFGVANEFGDKGLGYSGAAVNPTNGDLYVLDAYYSEIDVFNPTTGILESSFPVAPSANFKFIVPWTVVGIATDSAGNVYVPVAPENKVLEYDPSECPALPEPCTLTPLKTFTGGSGAGALKGPTAVAVDPSGNLWVADTGNQRLEQLSPAGAPLSEIPAEGVQSLAVDSHGHLFAILRNSASFCGSLQPPCPHLLEYNSAGAQIADLGAGEYGGGEENDEHSEIPIMVATSDSTGRVYVADGINDRVFIYTPPTPPQLENELAVGVTTSEAKLGALVEPGGIGASYRFEYGTTTAYGQATPFPEGNTGAGFRSRTVWASPSGLQPGTTYHYRVVVANELGEVKGPDKTFTTATPAQAACPNDQLRTGFSATLPDCRAYELVTPPNRASAQPDKNVPGTLSGGSLTVEGTLEENYAAVDGNRLSFGTEDVLPGSPSAGQSYVATRGPGGWSSQNMFPRSNYYAFHCPLYQKVSAGGGRYSDDLSKAIVADFSGGGCGIEPELISGEPRGTQNLYLRDNATGTYQLINLTPPGVTPAPANLLAASRDLGRIVFHEQAQLTHEALPGADNLYEWNAGHLRLLTLLPDETAVAGSFIDISADGSHVFFTAAGNLYARLDGAETVQLDASQASGPGGGGKFLKASSDGSRVLFTDDAAAALTADTQPASGANLYLYDSTAPAGQRLTDLTPAADTGAPALAGLSKDGSRAFFTDDASAALTADTVPGSGTNLYRYAAGQLTDLTPSAQSEVQGIIGVSEDGSSVYFSAEGVLTGSHANQYGETAQPGQPNLYISRAGVTTFITHGAEIGGFFNGLEVSANGAFLAFESPRKLTPYDNTNPSTGQPDLEIYLYAAATDSLACASCNPSGEPPTAAGPGSGALIDFRGAFEQRTTRNLTENGQVFFDSSEALLPADTNGKGGCSLASGVPACDDVYEFEPQGVGSCSDPAGCLFLISTGTGTLETFFIDASPSGNDVFIREYQKLVPRDAQDGAPSLYDVRVDGGFPEPSSPPPCTTAESCRPSPQPQPSIAASPATATLSGPGNVKPARKHHKKRHHKKHKRHTHRAVNTNRGGHK
jgi:DNA-binding beta-propeller fold protein YncE